MWTVGQILATGFSATIVGFVYIVYYKVVVDDNGDKSIWEIIFGRK